jgi:NAD(P)-dependent dehydrogenase (short-subunit alcohol dehydrogenase family)
MKKVAIVTGGIKGIGLGIAKGLFDANYRVVLNYHSDDKGAEEATKNFNSEDVAYIKADITEDEERIQLLENTNKLFGGFDVLINNAGIIRDGRFLELSFVDYHEIMRCNFYAPIFLAQRFANNLISEKKGGAIINVLSIGAYHAGNMTYCTSKAALLSATKCMAKELAKHNIRVNSISPGMVPTHLNEKIRISSPERWKKMLKKNPMGRAADPSEMAGAVVYLASDAASYTTGTDIIIDGGMLA